jgi:hypothetical protein
MTEGVDLSVLRVEVRDIGLLVLLGSLRLIAAATFSLIISCGSSSAHPTRGFNHDHLDIPNR